MGLVRRQKGSLTRVVRSGGTEVWVYRWREIDKDGQLKARKFVVGETKTLRTKTAAWDAVGKLNLKINLDRSHAGRPANVSELIEHFKLHELDRELESDERRSFSTVLNCRHYLSRWIDPYWGERAIDSMDASEVEDWLDKLRLRPKKGQVIGDRPAPGTKKKIRDILHQLFAHAKRRKWISDNPISEVRQGGKRRKTPVILDENELGLLLSALELREEVAVFLDFSFGGRRGELAGLRWRNFDFANRVLRLECSLVYQREGKLKTEASDKPVPLSEPLVDLLMRWRDETPYAQDDDFVFASAVKKGKQPYWMSRIMQHHIQPVALKLLGKKISWHTLRHSYATLLQANNDDAKVVQELVRHASIAITMNIYAQAVSDKKRQANRKVVEMVVAKQKAMAAEGLNTHSAAVQ